MIFLENNISQVYWLETWTKMFEIYYLGHIFRVAFDFKFAVSKIFQEALSKLQIKLKQKD